MTNDFLILILIISQTLTFWCLYSLDRVTRRLARSHLSLTSAFAYFIAFNKPAGFTVKENGESLEIFRDDETSVEEV